MQNDKRAYFAAIIEDAEAHLDQHVEACKALRAQFDAKKPEIQAVASGPDVDEEDKPLDTLESRRDAFDKLAAEAEALRGEVADLYQEVNALGSSLEPGEGGPLDPLQDLDPFAEDENLLQEVHRVLERYQIVIRARLNPFAEALAETKTFLVETRDAYWEEADSIDGQIENLRSARETH
jgi:hypothetical protein